MAESLSEREWQEWLAKLKSFRETFGHSRVPRNWVRDPAFARWVAKQQSRFHELSLERLEELYSLGFHFMSNGYWLTRFFELLEFKRKKGHCNVPSQWPENLPLGMWAQRQRRRKSTLPAGRIKLFNRIGFDWAPLETAWRLRYDQLVLFRKRFGHCNVPEDWAENPKLARWVTHHRSHRDEASALHQRLLQRLGFDWAPIDTVWKTHLEELRQYRKANGHCNVPRTQAGNLRLADWVSKLRRRGKDGIPARWLAPLEALKFDWDLRQGRWEARFAELVDFRRRFGHCRVPSRWPENQALSYWVTGQRGLDNPRLTAEQRRRLNELGFSWDARQDKWEERFSQLESFWKEHGNCEVPWNWPVPGLSKWMSAQRSRKHTLSPDRIRKLDQLKFRWLEARSQPVPSEMTGKFPVKGT